MKLTESQLKSIIKKEIMKVLKEDRSDYFSDSPRAILSDLAQDREPDEEGLQLLKKLPPECYDIVEAKITDAGKKWLEENPA